MSWQRPPIFDSRIRTHTHAHTHAHVSAAHIMLAAFASTSRHKVEFPSKMAEEGKGSHWSEVLCGQVHC